MGTGFAFERAPGAKSCGLGQTMSGVIAAMRRSLLSCTSLARYGLMTLGVTALVSTRPAYAADLPLLDAIATFFEMNHQEIAALTTAFALLGFSVVAAILLMRTRLRAASNEARLRAEGYLFSRVQIEEKFLPALGMAK